MWQGSCTFIWLLVCQRLFCWYADRNRWHTAKTDHSQENIIFNHVTRFFKRWSFCDKFAKPIPKKPKNARNSAKFGFLAFFVKLNIKRRDPSHKISSNWNVIKYLLFHTYWDFRIESIAWKTHTEIFSSNHNRESTFSHVGKAVSSNQKSAVRMNQSVSSQTRSRCFWRLFNLHSQKLVEFPQVYSSFLENMP